MQWSLGSFEGRTWIHLAWALPPCVAGLLLDPVVHHQVARDIARGHPQRAGRADEDMGMVLADPQPQRRRFLARGVDLRLARRIGDLLKHQRRKLVQHGQRTVPALGQPRRDRAHARPRPGQR